MNKNIIYYGKSATVDCYVSGWCQKSEILTGWHSTRLRSNTEFLTGYPTLFCKVNGLHFTWLSFFSEKLTGFRVSGWYPVKKTTYDIAWTVSHKRHFRTVCVCVPSHVSHLKHWVWEVCVCPISLCPIYKIEEGGQKVGVFFMCVVSHLIFFWVSLLTG